PEVFLNGSHRNPFPRFLSTVARRPQQGAGQFLIVLGAGHLGGMLCSRRALARIIPWPSWYTWSRWCENSTSLSIVSENLLRNCKKAGPISRLQRLFSTVSW